MVGSPEGVECRACKLVLIPLLARRRQKELVVARRLCAGHRGIHYSDVSTRHVGHYLLQSTDCHASRI